MRPGPIWPVTLECGDLILRPIRYRDKKEWTQVRGRNSEWLAGLGLMDVLKLAAQKTVENLFGGVALIADLPTENRP